MPEADGPVPLRFDAGVGAGPVSALLQRPRQADLLYLLGHGAGAGMRHPFLQAIADALGAAGVATFRYQFPYMEEGRRSPDPPHVAEATVRSAVTAAARAAPELPLIAGGKSFGGRMTSSAAAKSPLPAVRGLAFLGFPLHPPNRPADTRAAHLSDVQLPMLFLQGTRDDLADLGLIRGVCQRLGARATLHVVDDADHSFHVPKRAARSADDVLQELAHTLAAWAKELISVSSAR
ncbi:MAG: dienelactone hydrolase family protein [Gemmatimonadetes bacterium]|nr:dienelactone hydrolase family protein [Gemmatimonadota bacterium]